MGLDPSPPPLQVHMNAHRNPNMYTHKDGLGKRKYTERRPHNFQKSETDHGRSHTWLRAWELMIVGNRGMMNDHNSQIYVNSYMYTYIYDVNTNI